MSKTINFKRERDLGAIITDTFGFIRNQWKPYFTVILKILWPFIAVSVFILVMYLYSFGNLFSSLTNVSTRGSSPFTFEGSGSIIWGLLLMLTALITYTLLHLASMYYIKSYIENPDEIDFKAIVQQTRIKFWSLLGFLFLSYFLMIIGIFLCFFPGIYLMIVFALGTPIMIFENKGVGDTLSYCFTLIKDKWFETFGVLFVVGFLVGILGYVFNIPALIYTIFKAISTIGKNDPTAFAGIITDPIYVILNVISYAGRFLLSAVTIISTAFVYFDLNEQKFQSGTIETIESLGNN